LINLRLNKTITKYKKIPFLLFFLTYSMVIGFCLIPTYGLSDNKVKNFYENYLAQAKLSANTLQFKQAELNFTKAIDYCDSLKNWTCVIETANQLTEHWIKTAEYQKADSLLIKNLKIAKKRLPKNAAIKSNLLYLQALFQFKQGNHQKAFELVKGKGKSTNLDNYKDSLHLANIFELKGWIQTELSLFDNAFESFNNAYSLHPKKNMQPAVANYYFNVGIYFFKIKDYTSAEKKLIKSLQLRMSILPVMHPLIADCQFWLGKIQTKKKRFKQADSLFQASFKSRSNIYKNKLHPAIAESFEGLGKMHQQQANYTKAIQYYQLSVDAFKKIFPKQHPYLAKVYSNMASAQKSTNDYQKAYKSYTKAMGIFKKFYGNQHIYYLTGLYNLGLLNMNAEKLDDALTNFKDAITLAEETKVDKALLDRFYYETAVVYFHLDNYDKMNDYLTKVENITFDQYIQLSKIHFENKNYADALNFLTHTETIGGKKSFSNQVDFYYWQAKTNYALHQQNRERFYLDEAQKAIQNCDDLIQERRKEVGELLRFNKRIRPAYELALQIFEAGYQSSNDSIFIDLAFQFIHTSKAHVLLNRLNENKAIQLGLTANLIEKEQNFRREINRLQQEENREKVENKDSVKQLLMATQSAYNAFKNQLENEYPQYYKLKYGTHSINIQQVQENLNNQTSVIEYFLSDEWLYIVQIEKKDKRFFKISKPDDLFSQINVFRKTINLGIVDSIPPEDIYRKFIDQATSLYQNVLAKPVQAVVTKNIQQLIFIPDNQLNYLPFDLLLTDSLSITHLDEINYTMLPYLLKKYAVGYAYSSSFLTNEYQLNNNRKRLNYIGYAPTYESTAKQMVDDLSKQNKTAVNLRSGYNNLSYTTKAVVKIDSILNGDKRGKSYINEAADKQKFIENVNRAKIQHLAMHGEVDDENPYNSKLIFNDENLTMGDLNTLQINADLAVLTACKTGDGQLKNGEGVMSLSRAFIYAGCPSVVMSLWNLPDEQTAKLSELFFINLKNGMPKHEALQQAKLSYLQNPTYDFAAHPFFWGGLVATGDMEPVFQPMKEKSMPSWYLLILFFPILFVLPKLASLLNKYR